MAGGEYPDGSASKAVWRYDPTLDIWQEVESMQTPRSELGKYRLDIAWGSYRPATCYGITFKFTFLFKDWHCSMVLCMQLVDGKVLQDLILWSDIILKLILGALYQT